ncbi:porphobilinogen synthase [Egibacter rhizosphaerae]|uniref:Delta-aminolevulinic acid dehydratase n=1 Tax=Egibacter rhizosphaerae TaxID=1670831 RepID=A0A411YGG3_9ACTN|nr:porphobilinogen synthase [Egibacter rhizosphaerae]QBI20330.1 porphobilinogen synthase [Egibacter rhizosphaerae]
MSPRPTDPASPAAFPAARPRRLRHTAALRDAVRETSLAPGDLVAPLFVKEGLDEPQAVPSLPGVQQHTVDSLLAEAKELRALGIRTLLLFGIPAHKDADGSEAWNPDGILQRALAALREAYGHDLVLAADTCLDEYTDHGHCGPLDSAGHVRNDDANEGYARAAVSQARAGADLVAPSGMMDGQVAAIRRALDEAGFAERTAIMSYCTKYASVLYGPFRDVAESAPSTGDRRGYQLDPANADEGVREALADAGEGADVLLVKPATAYLDLVHRVKEATGLPLAAYHVSGEYAMLQAAAERGWIDGPAVAEEVALSLRRAGADLVITYAAAEIARRLA